LAPQEITSSPLAIVDLRLSNHLDAAQAVKIAPIVHIFD
jgi:hypothetical protein